MSCRQVAEHIRSLEDLDALLAQDVEEQGEHADDLGGCEIEDMVSSLLREVDVESSLGSFVDPRGRKAKHMELFLGNVTYLGHKAIKYVRRLKEDVAVLLEHRLQGEKLKKAISKIERSSKWDTVAQDARISRHTSKGPQGELWC